MTTPEIVAAIVTELDFGPETAAGMKNRVRANLLYLAKVPATVTTIGMLSMPHGYGPLGFGGDPKHDKKEEYAPYSGRPRR